jgi:glycosyltransferase involved in cell wall biosynthesis
VLDRPAGHGAVKLSGEHDAARTAPTAPLISVVIPCKNAVNEIAGAVESVLAQDYPEVSCIVVDGGSTDGTFAVLEKYGKEITLISEHDSGPFDALNKGFGVAEGSILAWLGVKDRWLQGSAAMAARLLKECPEVDVVYGCFGVANAEGGLERILPALDWDLREVAVAAKDPIYPGTAFFRRSVFEQAGPFRGDMSYIEDFWLRVALKGGKYRAVPVLMAYSHQVGGKRADAALITRARIDLTKRVFADGSLPAAIQRERRTALSNMYLKCILSLSVNQASHWLQGLALLLAAMRADLRNTTNSLAEVRQPLVWYTGQALQRPRRALQRALRFLTAPLRWRPRLLGNTRALAPLMAPLLVLAGIAGAASTAVYPDVLTEEMMRRAGQILTPVALLAIWLELRRRN